MTITIGLSRGTAIFLCLLLGACENGQGSGPDNCDRDGLCEGPGETRATCPEDCLTCNNDGVCEGAYEGPTTCPTDCPPCDHDLVCDSPLENPTNCPGDCPCDGNGTCDAPRETAANCAWDCPCDANGVCEPAAGETTVNCPADCLCDGDGSCEPVQGETAASCPGDCPCDGDGICEPQQGETSANCASDCASTCDLAQMTGPHHDFIVQQLFLPDSATSGLENGVDLNGDGIIDNKLGSIMSLLTQQGMGDINLMKNGEITAGELVILLRLSTHTVPGAPGAIQLFLGTPGSPPAFNGTDQLTVAAGFPTNQHLCTDWQAPALNTTAGPLPLFFRLDSPVPHVYMATATQFVTDTGLYPASAVTTAGLVDVMVGGGVTPNEINTSIISPMVTYFGQLIAADPSGSTATTLLGLFDNNCDETICPNAGSDPNCAADNVVTTTELTCNMLINTALAPDVDLNGDGVNDVLSFGFRIVAAVPATILGM